MLYHVSQRQGVLVMRHALIYRLSFQLNNFQNIGIGDWKEVLK